MIVAVACAVTVTGLLIRKEFFAPQLVAGGPRPDRVTDDWPAIRTNGQVLSQGDTGITLVVYSDFQCPYCERFATTTMPVLDSLFPNQVRIQFKHWPLPNHEHAEMAAEAAECGGAQGHFVGVHDALFANTDSIGRAPWEWFATEARVPDLPAFTMCMTDGVVHESIRESAEEASRFGFTGTPTVIVNGTVIGLVDPYRLRSLIETHLTTR